MGIPPTKAAMSLNALLATRPYGTSDGGGYIPTEFSDFGLILFGAGFFLTIIFAFIWSGLDGSKSSKLHKLRTVPAVLAGVALVCCVGGVGVAGVQVVNFTQGKTDNLISWADDRYGVELGENAAKTLNAGSSVIVGGTRINLDLNSDDSYYLYAGSASDELPVKK